MPETCCGQESSDSTPVASGEVSDIGPITVTLRSNGQVLRYWRIEAAERDARVYDGELGGVLPDGYVPDTGDDDGSVPPSGPAPSTPPSEPAPGDGSVTVETSTETGGTDSETDSETDTGTPPAPSAEPTTSADDGAGTDTGADTAPPELSRDDVVAALAATEPAPAPATRKPRKRT